MNPESLRDHVHRLLQSESFAVLCTHGAGGAHASLIAYDLSDDLRRMIFATPLDTKKYRLLQESPHVALLVDNRERSMDATRLEAITAVGRARIVTDPEERRRLAEQLEQRHAYLQPLLAQDSTVIFVVEVTEYEYVTNIQQVQRLRVQ